MPVNSRAATLGMNELRIAPRERPSPKRRPCLAGKPLLRGTKEEQHEGEQNQRLNERQSDEQCELDARPCAGVPGQSFGYRAGYFSLSQTCQASGKTHAEANADGNGPVA